MNYDEFRGTKGYAVFRRPGRFGTYSVTFDGQVIDAAFTRWGARWAVRKHRRRSAKAPFWECPIVYRQSA